MRSKTGWGPWRSSQREPGHISGWTPRRFALLFYFPFVRSFVHLFIHSCPPSFFIPSKFIFLLLCPIFLGRPALWPSPSQVLITRLPPSLPISPSASSGENQDCHCFFCTHRNIIQINSNKQILKISIAFSWPSETYLISRMSSTILMSGERKDFLEGEWPDGKLWVSLQVCVVQLRCGPARSPSRGCRADRKAIVLSPAFIVPGFHTQALPAYRPESGPASSPRSSIFNSMILGSFASEIFRLKKKTWHICGCLSKHKQLNAGFCGNTYLKTSGKHSPVWMTYRGCPVVTFKAVLLKSGPVAPASPGSLLKRHVLGAHSRPADSETLGGHPAIRGVEPALQEIVMHTQVWGFLL